MQPRDTSICSDQRTRSGARLLLSALTANAAGRLCQAQYLPKDPHFSTSCASSAIVLWPRRQRLPPIFLKEMGVKGKRQGDALVALESPEGEERVVTAEVSQVASVRPAWRRQAERRSCALASVAIALRSHGLMLEEPELLDSSRYCALDSTERAERLQEMRDGGMSLAQLESLVQGIACLRPCVRVHADLIGSAESLRRVLTAVLQMPTSRAILNYGACLLRRSCEAASCYCACSAQT